MKDLVPVIDTEVLQEKVNQAAMKGALSTIEDFYTGYNSPFKKAIKEDLESKEINYLVDPKYSHYSANLYNYEAYKVNTYI